MNTTREHNAWSIGALRLSFLVFITAVMLIPADCARAYTSHSAEEGSYDAYIALYASAASPVCEIPAEMSGVGGGAQLYAQTNYKGRENVALLKSPADYAEYTLTVEQEGLYQISFDYYINDDTGKAIYIGLSVDGETPFSTLSQQVLLRMWKNVGAITRDQFDNDILPEQIAVQTWQTHIVCDPNWLYNAPFSIYLTSGTHVLRLTADSDNVAVTNLRAGNETPAKNYAQQLAEYEAAGYTAVQGVRVDIQGEDAALKSHSTIYATSDRSGPGTVPSHPSKIRLNTIGADNWKESGQWISWNVEVPETGLYTFCIKGRQNETRGMISTRELMVDGKLPFAECASIVFPYSDTWLVQQISDEDGTPYLIYLTQGAHTITLKASLGKMAPIIRALDDAMYDLNVLYRRILMVTGSNPDANRDYQLDKEIPGLNDDILTLRDTLNAQLNTIENLTGSLGSEAVIISETLSILNKFLEDPDNITLLLDSFKSQITSMGSLLLSIRSTPLEVDYLTLLSSDMELMAGDASLWEKIKYDASAFMASFTEKYNTIGQVEDAHAIEVWIGSSRDQASILNSLITDSFTAQTGISVNLSLVSGIDSTLMQAVLMGKGPDVALQLSQDLPVNLAMRGALTDLSTFYGFDEIKERFYPSALVPFGYKGGCYALPETQSFNMLFYRKDIFEELGLEPPETWDDLYAIIPVIQKYNMQVGILESYAMANSIGNVGALQIFETLLYQHGGTMYNESMTRTGLDTSEALSAFKQWTGLYTRYGLERSFDFYSRFRTGEIPIGISGYSMYNSLSVSAPELNGLWDMIPLPGMRKEDGSVNRTTTSTGTGCIIVGASNKQEAAYEFLKWWTSAETQARYGLELEALMGPAARYDTANIEAFDRLPWNRDEAAMLKKQWEQVVGIPQVPGNYYILRNIVNAFRQVVNNFNNERETLSFYNTLINEEMKRKGEEFDFADYTQK